jgi:hypothetical protein
MGLFDKLSGSPQKVFRDMRGYGKLSEQNIQDALRGGAIASAHVRG